MGTFISRPPRVSFILPKEPDINGMSPAERTKVMYAYETECEPIKKKARELHIETLSNYIIQKGFMSDLKRQFYHTKLPKHNISLRSRLYMQDIVSIAFKLKPDEDISYYKHKVNARVIQKLEQIIEEAGFKCYAIINNIYSFKVYASTCPLVILHYHPLGSYRQKAEELYARFAKDPKILFATEMADFGITVMKEDSNGNVCKNHIDLENDDKYSSEQLKEYIVKMIS